jgi:hypothetical protein
MQWPKKKNDKQCSKKHYTENWRLSSTNPTSNLNGTLSVSTWVFKVLHCTAVPGSIRWPVSLIVQNIWMLPKYVENLIYRKHSPIHSRSSPRICSPLIRIITIDSEFSTLIVLILIVMINIRLWLKGKQKCTEPLSSKQITHFELPYVLGNLAGLFVTGTLTLSSILPFSGYFRLRLLVQVR